MTDTAYVLDASALLALMLDERGAARVEACLPDACVGAVNLSEVVAKLQERGVADGVIDESLTELDLRVVDFTQAQARMAGQLRMATKAHGLSLGDRACLALAANRGATALTTDTKWADIDIGIPIELAR
ncbi:MAG: type II toxin-antitoxin system VapC family toxin [Sphingobium sp.]